MKLTDIVPSKYAIIHCEKLIWQGNLRPAKMVERDAADVVRKFALKRLKVDVCVCMCVCARVCMRVTCY